MRKIFTTTLFCCMGYILFGQVYTLPYAQNFDTFPVDNVNFGPGAEPFPLVMDWVNVQAGDDAQDWYGRSTATGSSNTGPSADHTSGTGVYMFVEDGFGTFTNIQLESPLFDLTSVTGGVQLSYWAHSWTTSTAGNSMAVDVFDGSVWVQVDSFGILSSTDTWFQRFVDLSAYTGDTIQLRWRGANNVTSFTHDIAIDDVEIVQTSLTAIVQLDQDASCAGFSDGMLTASTSFGTPPYTYLWNTGDTSATLTAPAGTYCVVVTDSVGDTDSTCGTIMEPSPVTFQVSAMNPTVCFGDSNAMISIDSAMGGIPLPACGLAHSTAQCVGSEDTLQIGQGTTTNTNTAYPAPFGNWYWGARQQVIFRADELIAAGVQPGLIKGMAWDVDTITGGGTTTFTDYEIRLGCTSDTVLSTAWVSVPDVVFPATTITIDTTWNWFNFPVPFVWDGNENLVVEFCFNNTSFTRNAESPYTATSYTSCHFYRADNSTVCGNPANSGISSNRPNIRFANCSSSLLPYNLLWSTGDMTPSLNGVGAGTYTVLVSDANGCGSSDTIVIDEAVAVSLADEGVCDGGDVILDPGTYNSYLWSTGDSTPTITVGSMAMTYGVTVVDSNGCTSSDSASITTLANPNPNAGADVQACADATPITLDAGAGFAGYSWSSGDTTQTTDVTMSGVYDVVVTDTNGCEGADTVEVTVNPNPSVNLGSDTTVCQFDLPYSISAPSATSYLWSTGATTQSIDVDTAAGVMSYSVVITDANGCTGSDTIDITVEVCVGIFEGSLLQTQVYPNPTQQLINVSVNELNAAALNIRVVDLNGRVVMEKSDDNHAGSAVIQLDLGQLAKGMYYLHIENDGRNSVHRITLQ